MESHMILARLQFSEKENRVINCVDTFKCNYYNKPLCFEVRKKAQEVRDHLYQTYGMCPECCICNLNMSLSL